MPLDNFMELSKDGHGSMVWMIVLCGDGPPFLAFECSWRKCKLSRGLSEIRVYNEF